MLGRVALTVALVACRSSTRDAAVELDAASAADGSGKTDDPGQQGCGTLPNCFSVYAHSNTHLYVVDLMSKTLQTVGPFDAPNNETITDLAVAPDDTIYVISASRIYTASPVDGHVTLLGTLANCGSFGVALTTLPNGEVWMGDYGGNLCRIDITTSPPTVLAPVRMTDNLALAGDFAAVADGTLFGTAYDRGSTPTQQNNILVTIDVTNGQTTRVGATGFPRLYGVAFGQGVVLGFTHDGSGRVVQVDTSTGTGTLFATFTDPATQRAISFAGAGVNSLVPILL